MFTQWRAHGRDPQKGIVIARYEPRDGQTPAGLRYLRRMGYDMRCFTGDVLALAVAGRLRIREEEILFKNEWQLERVAHRRRANCLQAQNLLLETACSRSANTLVLKNTSARPVSSAARRLTEDSRAEYHPRYFKRNGKSSRSPPRSPS